ncbi:MAG: NUDIX hydrolase [Clostridia bacterium]|nr:NUDIX hydrolase [Clostridia bacterium]
MSNYIMDLRRTVGHSPLMMCCSGVLVVEDEKRILLQQRTDNGCWGIPGGSVELGETLEEAAVREIYEEMGITIKNPKLFHVYSGKEHHYIYPNGDEVYIIDNIFVVTQYTGELKPDGVETSRVQFFNIDHLPEEIHPPNRTILIDFIHRYFKK